jgi:hypothetical protein
MEVGGITYTVDARTDGVLRLEKQISTSTSKIEADLNRVDDAAERVGQSLQETGRQADVAGNSMGRFNGIAGQLGFQMQDVAVQLQSGTSAFVVLGQQGSQIASAFGPGGAVVGAVIAVASAIGGVLFSSITKTADEIKQEFIPTIEDMKDKLDQISSAQASFGILTLTKELKPLETQARNAAAQVEFLEKQIAKYPSNKDIAKWNETLIEQRAILDGVNQKTKEKKDLMAALEDVISRVTKGTQGQQSAEKKQAETAAQLAAQIQAATLKLTEGELAARRFAAAQYLGLTNAEQLPPELDAALVKLYEIEEAQKRVTEQKRLDLQAQREITAELDKELQAELSMLNQKKQAEQKVTTEFESVQKAVTAELETPAQKAERELAERLTVIQAYGEQEKLAQDQIDAYKAKAAEATEKRITDITKQEQDQRRQMMQTTLGSIGDLFGNMADIAKEGGEKSFKTWKMMASAQAAINAALAITNVLATVPAPFNIPLAASVGALAAVNIAKIQGQQYSGRLYGGPVNPGGIYPITEDGRPEILQQGNRQYLLPGSGGRVISNRDMQKTGGGGSITINYSPTIYAQEADFEAIMASQPEAVLNAVRVGLASEGRTI